MDFKVERQLTISMTETEANDLREALDENSIVYQSTMRDKYLSTKQEFLKRLHYEFNPATVPQKGNGLH